MKIRNKILDSIYRDDKNIDVLHDSLYEAWMRQHLLSRFTRFILTIVISVVISLILVNASYVNSARESCERNIPIYTVIPVVLNNASDRIKRVDPKLSLFYREQARIVTKNKIDNCNEKYQYVWPVRYLLD